MKLRWILVRVVLAIIGIGAAVLFAYFWGG